LSDSSWTGPSGEAPLHGHSEGYDLLVLKLDPEGAYEWHTFYGAVYNQSAYSLAVDGSGNIYVTGSSYSSWTGPSGEVPLHAHSGERDFYILKLDSDGAYAWHTFYGCVATDWGSSLAVDGSGNIYVTGWSNLLWTGPSGEEPLYIPPGDYYIYILKLDPDGEYAWHTFSNDDGTAVFPTIGLDGCGEIYLTGMSNSSWTGPDGESPLHAHSGDRDFYILKLGPDAAYEWHTFYGSDLGDTGGPPIVDGNGNVYVAGCSSYSWTGPSGEPPLHEHSDYPDIFVLKHSI
jgi:hypothetical protein